MNKIIGRGSEKELLAQALKSKRPELIVIYGRRRIGKTYLIRETYKQYIQFEFSGLHNVSYKDQLKNFNLVLHARNPKSRDSSDWIEAFYQLELYFNKLKGASKKVLFIDEFPWLDTRKSNFLAAFDRFWNSYASKRKDIIVVVCGSAASYIIKNIIRNKGGLHNRLTQAIQLEPFSLQETEDFLKHFKIKLTRYDILQLYMAMGGVPHYLEKIVPGESVSQALDRLCFSKNGFLHNEFQNVFASLFNAYDNHEAIVRSLSKIRKGVTRTQLLAASKINSGGTLTKTLEELEDSGFIEKSFPYKGTKDAIYRLTDEYSLFYLKFIESVKPSKRAIWMKIQGEHSYKIWAGFSFETICIKHVDQIKEALKIGGIHSTHGSWIGKAKSGGAQIDLLIDRDDDVINLCEMKFYSGKFLLDKKYATEIAEKGNIFKRSTDTKKSIFNTFITTYGLVDNAYRKQYIQNELTLEHLFIKL